MLISLPLYGQQSNKLPDFNSLLTTPKWNFLCNSYVVNDSIYVQIARNQKGGWLKIAVETTNPINSIGGNLYIDLKDFSTIRCVDKGMNATENKLMIAYFALNQTEMLRLQKNDITAVRFFIKGKGNRFSGQTGYFTALNKKRLLRTTYGTDPGSYSTAPAVKELFTNK